MQHDPPLLISLAMSAKESSCIKEYATSSSQDKYLLVFSEVETETSFLFFSLKLLLPKSNSGCQLCRENEWPSWAGCVSSNACLPGPMERTSSARWSVSLLEVCVHDGLGAGVEWGILSCIFSCININFNRLHIFCFQTLLSSTSTKGQQDKA